MSSSSSKGWLVTLAGTGINLALGVLYAWSTMAKALTSEWGWTASAASIPYAVACGVFAIAMVIGGRLQDKYGPRLIAGIGGVLTSAGLIISSFASKTDSTMLIIGFGILGGIGIGFGYGSTTPPAQKWFAPAKRGLITGIVVSGFGLGPVYIAPITKNLLGSVGINQTFMTLGIGCFIITVLLSQVLKNPPAGYVPAGMPTPGSTAGNKSNKHEYDWNEMLRTPQFYLLWIMYAFASFAGLMVIGHLAKIAANQAAGATLALSLVVPIYAVGNAFGRILAGTVSDKLGRTRTLFLFCLSQAVVMALMPQATSGALIIIGALAIGVNYGSNLSLFPSTVADYFGSKNFGVNYGFVFTAWGIGGVFGSMVAGKIVDMTGSYAMAFTVAAVLCALAAATTFITKAPKTISVQKPNIAG